MFVPRPRGARTRVLSPVDVPLDPTQREAIALPAGRALLVLGEAGHGKTTVLLHRVAALFRASERSARAAVIAPTEGLVRLLSSSLARLGADVDVWTLDQFAAKQARRVAMGYRCPPAVVAVARGVRDGALPEARVHRFADERELATELSRALAALERRDPRASVAVLCRRRVTARRLATMLDVPARLVFDGRFLPRGPAQISVATEVKCLEFDYVVIPDATALEWPDDAAARRAMYVAITRARHQVVFAATSAPTPLMSTC